MAVEQGIFDGRRGQKRLKLIEKHKVKILSEFTTEYENSQEMSTKGTISTKTDTTTLTNEE